MRTKVLVLVQDDTLYPLAEGIIRRIMMESTEYPEPYIMYDARNGIHGSALSTLNQTELSWYMITDNALMPVCMEQLCNPHVVLQLSIIDRDVRLNFAKFDEGIFDRVRPRLYDCEDVGRFHLEFDPVYRKPSNKRKFEKRDYKCENVENESCDKEKS